MVTTGNGLCSLTVTAVCRIGWSLLATGMGGFPSPEAGTGERGRSEIEKRLSGPCERVNPGSTRVQPGFDAHVKGV